MSDDRYARQRSIPHWDQDRLARARGVVVGSGPLAGHVGWGAACLGIGELVFLDNRPAESGATWPGLEPLPGRPAVQALALAACQINPSIRSHALMVRLLYDAHVAAIPPCDLIVETTNDPYSQQIGRLAARKWGIPLIVATAGPRGGTCTIVAPDAPFEPLLAYRDAAQGGIAAQAVAGLALDAIRATLLPMPRDRQPVGPVSWALAGPERCRNLATSDRAGRIALGSQHHALVVGAGALGTFAALGLAQGGIGRLTIVDFDRVEETNLNRQPLYFDAVGRPKSTTLARRLAALFPRVQLRGIVAPAEPAHLDGVDVVLLCVDTFQARSLVSRYATQRGLPLVNGGTGPWSGEVAVCQPGVTACLGCRIGVGRLAAIEAGRRASCADVPESSVVISNLLIGALMATEAATILHPDRYGTPIAGTLAYDAFQPARLGIRSPRPPCRCHEKELGDVLRPD